MIFNPNLPQQAQEVTFSRKIDKISRPTTTFTIVDNKIPNFDNFVKKTDYNTKISKI